MKFGIFFLGALASLSFSSLLKAEATLPTLECMMTYNDKSMQEKPLFESSFEVDLNKKDPPHKFGVSPGGQYYAGLTLNGSKDDKVSGIVGLIMNVTTDVRSLAIYPLDAKELHILHQVTDNKTLQLYCKTK